MHGMEPNPTQQVAYKILLDVLLLLDGMPRKVLDIPTYLSDLVCIEYGMLQLERRVIEAIRDRRARSP